MIFRHHPLMACLAAAIVATAAAPAGENTLELRNGGFELAERAPDGAPVGWHFTEDTGGRVHCQGIRVRSGQRAVSIVDERADTGYILETDFYPAVPGARYQAAGWAYNGAGDGWLYLEFYADATTRVREVHAGCGKQKEWAPIVVDAVCPEDARYVCVALYSSIANVGETAWDDVALEGPRGKGEVLAKHRAGGRPAVDYSYLREVGDKKQLLFDDAFLASHRGWWWRVCHPRKTGERNLVADRPWESFGINAWHTVMEDEGRYRMWYEAYDKSYTSDLQARYCYAESRDGIHWRKPHLGLVSYNGSRQNNILFDSLGGQGVHGGTVFKDPVAPPEERYKFVYLGPAGPDTYAVRAALSPDGIHWRPYEGGPVLNVSSDTQTVAFWDPRIRKYVAYCRLWTPNRTVGRSESSDFFRFPVAEEVLACDDRDPADADLYNSAAIRYPYAENAYLIFTSVYHHTADNLDVHLAVSRDGIHWTRPDRAPFIPNGEPGAFDDAQVYTGVGVLRVADELWMYYYGSRVRHNQNYPKWVTSHGVYTRAVLKLDRYVGMQANVEPAECATHPLIFTGDRLELNADVRPRSRHWPAGYVRVEIQDSDGSPIPGYTLDDCVPVVGDSVRHVVRWKRGSDLRSLAGKPVRLRCVARDATLYAFQFAKTR